MIPGLAASATAVTVNLLANTGSGGEAAGDTFTSIENLEGAAHNDTLTGDAGNNILSGLGGNDVLRGEVAHATRVMERG